MRIRGRVFIYGEYLVRLHTRGLIMPTATLLASEDDVAVPWHLGYRADEDGIAQSLRARGYKVERRVRGDLPLGYGLAGGTALAYLHLAQNGHPTDRATVNAIDAELHGFTPSGVDAESVARQSTGLFGQGTWQDVSLPSSFACSLALLDKERRTTLPAIRARVLSRSDALAPLCDRISAELLESGVFSYSTFFEYCRELQSMDVYSEAAQRAVATLMATGVAAKCVGGLYDKGVLVVWPDATTPPNAPPIEAAGWLARV